MKPEEFQALKPGEKVQIAVSVEGLPEIGTVLTRVKNWLDDGITNCFAYDADGVSDYGFFAFSEVEK